MLFHRATLAGVGQAYDEEAGRVRTLLDGGDRRPTLAVSFSPELLARLGPEAGVRSWKDVFSQRQEVANFRDGYRLADRLRRRLAGTGVPGLGALGTAFYHAWARELGWLAGIRRLARQESRLLCILDTPFAAEELPASLPWRWRYHFLPRDRQPYPLAQVVRADEEVRQARARLFAAEQERLGPESPLGPARPGEGARPGVLVVVDDAGSLINATSAAAAARALSEAGLEPVVLTSTPAAREALAPAARVYRLPEEPPPERLAELTAGVAAAAEVLARPLGGGPRWLWRLFAAANIPRLFGGLSFLHAVGAALPALAARHRLRAALAVNEGNSLPAAALEWLAGAGVPAAGLAPVLLMDHPMCCHWPAPHHLVYGEQAAELMARRGIPPRSIHVVGSEHFDRCARRDRLADRAWAERQFPEIRKDKLVIVATEARPRQLVEIEPALRLLAGRPGTFTVLKLHPDDRPEPFAELLAGLGGPARIRLVGRTDLAALLHAADLLITMGSNLIVEAAVMGVPSLSFNFSGTPCPIDFVAEGLCLGARSPAELERRLAGLLGDGPERAEARARLARVKRFNGPNDGASARRVAAFLAGLAGETAGRRPA